MKQQILPALSKIYEENLWYNVGNRQVVDYLRSRKIKDETIKKFRVGFCNYSTGFNVLNKKFAPEDLIATGFFKENGYGISDFFHNRITFPLIHNSEVSYMTSRALPGNDEACKYLHQHGSIPIALNHDCIADASTVFLVEGPFDCMTLAQEGFAAIGLLGAGRISHKIIEDLYQKTVVLVPDYDPNQAGQKGALRIAKKLMEYNIPSYIVKWPPSQNKIDVNSFFLEFGIEEFRSVLQDYEYFNEPQVKKEKQHTNAASLPPIMKAADKYLQGRFVGNKYVARCLWHTEKTGSLVVYEQSNSFYCFGCGKAGSTLDIVVKGEELLGKKITYRQAKELAKEL